MSPAANPKSGSTGSFAKPDAASMRRLTRVPKTAQPWVPTLVRTTFEQPGPASVRAQHAHAVTALEARLTQAAAHLDDAREDILAFTAFPRGVWRQIWGNNPQERLNKEVRRRTGVAGIFPCRPAIIRPAIIRLAGAVLAGKNDEWTESRRYMGLEILAACRKAARPDTGQNITTEAGSTVGAIPA
jgi:putative transposase